MGAVPSLPADARTCCCGSHCSLRDPEGHWKAPRVELVEPPSSGSARQADAARVH
jgi:hypothetical protein